MEFGELDFRNSGFGDLKFGELNIGEMKFGDLEGHQMNNGGGLKGPAILVPPVYAFIFGPSFEFHNGRKGATTTNFLGLCR